MSLFAALKVWAFGSLPTYVLIGGVGLLIFLAGYMRGMDAERAEHVMTKQELALARGLAETRLTEALAQQEALAACLARETDAANAASERAAIMKKALPRARAPEEARKVVDDETRAAVIARLNRSW